MIETEKSVLEYLEKYEQFHVILLLRSIKDPEIRAKLLTELNENIVQPDYMNFVKTLKTKKNAIKESKEEIIQLSSSTVVEMENVINSHNSNPRDFLVEGFQLIQNNKVGVIILAGGQGTRLGSSNPKGMFSIGLPSGKSLFQIHIEKVLSLKNFLMRTYNKECSIPIYIMTSSPTHSQTVEFFEKNDYFSYPSSDVIFFKQANIPSLSDPGGSILLKFSHDQQSTLDTSLDLQLVLSPDGNGSIFDALLQTGALEDIRKRKIEGLQVFCVDNVLAAVADPEFYGMCHGIECGSKAIEKVDPSEKVGVLCLRNKALSVIEYSEISDELRNKRDSENPENLAFRLGNICIHYFSFSFLEKICSKHLCDFPYHSASKNISGTLYTDADPSKIINQENPKFTVQPTIKAIKLEKFIFDCFQFAESYLVKLVDRRNEFSPLKNGSHDQENTPQTCLSELMQFNRRKLKKLFPDLNPQQFDHVIEISPLYYYNELALVERVSELLSTNHSALPPCID